MNGHQIISRNRQQITSGHLQATSPIKCYGHYVGPNCDADKIRSDFKAQLGKFIENYINDNADIYEINISEFMDDVYDRRPEFKDFYLLSVVYDNVRYCFKCRCLVASTPNPQSRLKSQSTINPSTINPSTINPQVNKVIDIPTDINETDSFSFDEETLGKFEFIEISSDGNDSTDEFGDLFSDVNKSPQNYSPNETTFVDPAMKPFDVKYHFGPNDDINPPSYANIKKLLFKFTYHGLKMAYKKIDITGFFEYAFLLSFGIELEYVTWYDKKYHVCAHFLELESDVSSDIFDNSTSNDIDWLDNKTYDNLPTICITQSPSQTH